MSTDWTQGSFRFRSLPPAHAVYKAWLISLCRFSVFCRSTPFQARVTPSMVPRQHYLCTHYSQLLQSLPHLPCSKSSFQLGISIWEIPPPLLHLPVSAPSASVEARVFCYTWEGLISLWNIVHQDFFAPTTFCESHCKVLFFPMSKGFHILLPPNWKQRPLGTLSHAKKISGQLHGYSAKNWEMWKGSEHIKERNSYFLL